MQQLNTTSRKIFDQMKNILTTFVALSQPKHFEKASCLGSFKEDFALKEFLRVHYENLAIRLYGQEPNFTDFFNINGSSNQCGWK
jgi:hypothetical protein